ncbi:MAG: M3 family oligoendopeptidase, partial [Clostridia bacterium]|nr:M3 family oligoendopeptidase [Clostridia bacterium]
MKMKVTDLPYKRIEVEEIRSQALAIIQKIKNASAVEDILAARKEMLAIHDEVNTQYSIAYMRFSLNTRDEFYAAEQEYYDEILPVFQLLMRDYAEAVLTSPLRSEIEKHLSPILIRSMENEVKASDPSILEEMQQENAIVSEYSKFMSGLIFIFRGEEMPLTILRRYMADDDRETRKEAYEVLGKTLDANRATFDDIYDRLVKIHTKMARKLGYENFIPLGYARMNRIDYTQENVEVFRANVLKDIVPVVSSIKRKNAAKMGIDKLMFYDNDVNIPGGNPKPVGGKEQIFAAGAKMYREMSPQTDEFFRMMLETEAFDVDSRDGKWGGGYCTEFPKYRQPFILANFNGTEADVGVITHEAGHAFASWLNFDSEYPDLGVGGMETAETHSMSMEFFAWKYMEEFFG